MEGGAQATGTNRAVAERWAQVRALLESALEHETSSRAEFLKEACGADRELLSETQTLLRALDSAPSYLNQPVAGLTLSQDPMVGASVGPWKLLRHIGTGGFASVYAAARNDQEFRKVVAIKVIKRGMDSDDILRRFRTERQILAGLDHPNITRLLDGGSTDSGVPYLAMEYVEGTPVTQYADVNRLSVTERLKLFCSICSAVDYAHRNLVVHRDLKPANILVTPDGVAKLLDFGIAKLLRPESPGYSMQFTQTQMRMLTPEYASPEQVRGDPITTATDIYSLGVVLYELLTGQRPYRVTSRSSLEIEHAICEWEPENPSARAAKREAVSCAEGTPAKLARRLRGELDAIVLTALRKEPRRRYATVDRLTEDIARHLHGLPVSVSGNTWRYRMAKFARRHKGPVAVAALVASILVGASVISTNLARQLQRQKQATLQLVSFMLGDFDTALRSGSTSARKASMDEVLANLKQLSPGTTNDPELRELLFKGYLKVAGLQGNIFESNLGDAGGAKQSYRRAETFARMPVELAQAAIGLGDVAYNSGDRKDALTQYQKAEGELERASHGAVRPDQLWPDLTRVWYKIGLTQWQLANLPQALESYQHELQIAQQWAQKAPPSPDVTRALALAEEHVGSALQQTNRAPEALTHLQRSLDVYRELLKLEPESAVRKLDVAIGELGVANVMSQLGSLENAEDKYRSSLNMIEALVSQDPQNEQYQRYRNSILHPFAEVLYREGNVAEARQMTVHAIHVLQPLIAKPDASSHDIYQYCWDLLTTPFQDLHRPHDVLDLAQKIAGLTHHTDPGVLNVLALAWEENGNLDQAIATEDQALALYPAEQPVTPGGKHAEIEANLARFRKKSTPHAVLQKQEKQN
jgi:serine/threonine protein kinase